jgi:nucleotidyltransferase/DNA polymerase involved in DNA repair
MNLIGSVHIPNLAVAVARRDDPALADHPLVLYTAARQRTIVAAASDDIGIAAGTPLRQAIVRYPHAMYRPADPERDRQIFATLITLLETFSPRVAPHALAPHSMIDLDLARISLPQAIVVMQQLAQRMYNGLRLLPALGVAATRFVAQRAAASAGTGATVIIPPSYEAAFLAPLPISALPIDADTIRRLQLLGLHTIGAVAQLPVDALQAQFGERGRVLALLARGGEHTPIAPTASRPTMARTAHFAGPVSNRALLETAIDRIVDRLTNQLAAGGWAAQAITLTLHVEDGPPWTDQRRMGAPTTDRAKLMEAFRALSRSARLESGVEAITLCISELAPTVTAQLELFASTSGQAKQLDHALDRLQARYAGSFIQARLADTSAQLPERRVRFEPQEKA